MAYPGNTEWHIVTWSGMREYVRSCGGRTYWIQCREGRCYPSVKRGVGKPRIGLASPLLKRSDRDRGPYGTLAQAKTAVEHACMQAGGFDGLRGLRGTKRPKRTICVKRSKTGKLRRYKCGR